MNNKDIKEQGFTLIEIMIAMVVFLIGILGVTAMQISAVKGNSSASGLSEAVIIAQDKMEELMMLDYQTAAVLFNGNHADVHDSGQASTFTQYNISWNITDNAPANELKTIIVTVTWTQNGVNRLVVLDSVKACTDC